MSHAEGRVKFNDGTIFYFEYNGTCGMILKDLYETHEELELNWRKPKINNCLCGQTETVEIATSYGHSFSWEGRACKKCKVIIDEFQADEYVEEISGLPEWWI